MTMVAPERVVLGSTTPRLYTAPLVVGRPGPCGCGCALTPETSYGFYVIDFARDVLRRPLDDWQRWLVIHAGELDFTEALYPNGRPRFQQVLVLVARQNGKTELCVILSLYWMFVERVAMVLGTSTKLQYARESWKKAVSLVRSVPELNSRIPKGGVRQANGEEELETSDGCRYLIAASNAEGGRSLTVNRLIMDELRQQHDRSAYDAATYAQNAVGDAQAFFISNQGEDRSVVLNSLRDQALAGTDEHLGLFEWSSPEGMAATDVAALAMANPNLGHRILLDTLIGQARRAEAAGGDELAGFLTEVHCRRVSLLNPAVDTEAWDRCRVSEGLDGVRERVALCLDVSIDELHASLYAAAVDGERVRVDVVAAWEGQTAVRDMCAALPDLVKRVNPRVVGWYPGGPAAGAAASLHERQGWPPPGVKIESIRSAVTAVCMGFAEQVRSGVIAHTGDVLLDAHVRAAEKLHQGDGWRFTRRGAGYVDAAYAAAGAVHLARTLPSSDVDIF